MINQKVKGWAGLILTLLPSLYFLPIPAVHAFIEPVKEILLVLSSAGGGAILASSPAIVGKNK